MRIFGWFKNKATVDPPPHPVVEQFRREIKRRPKGFYILNWGKKNTNNCTMLFECARAVDPTIALDAQVNGLFQESGPATLKEVADTIEAILVVRAAVTAPEAPNPKPVRPPK